MKRIRQIGAGLVALIVAGCATNPQKNAMDNLSDNRQQMNEAHGQVDRTLYSLDSLMRAPPAEIRSAHDQYAANVKSLREMANQLENSAQDMRARKIDYLTEWERAQLNVTSPELRRAGEQRRKEVVQNLTALESSLQSANQGIGLLLTDLEDVARVTGNDPTPAGIAAVKKSGIVQAARKHATAANYRLDVAASRFDSVLATLAPRAGTRPVGTASAPAATGAAGSSATAPMPSFEEADRNHSGAIERDEASQISGLDFKAADRNNDGKLSESEYEAVKKVGESSPAKSSSPAK